MKADRLVSILLLLQSSQRRTARDLAGALEVSERTIYRDVDALSAAGVPVFTERGAEGGIALAQGYRHALMHFGEEEIRALFASNSAVLADLGLAPNLDRALEKLRGGFSETQQRIAENARGRIHIDQRRWNQSDPPVEKLALLRRAVWDDRRIELSYEDRAGAATTRAADPLGLVSKAGVWYLVARTERGYRSFRVERIRDVSEMNERFERPADFDLDAHWRESSAALFERRESAYKVLLRIEPQAREAIGGYWPVESVEGDPTLVRVAFPDERSALFSVLGWGLSVEALEPSTLRDALSQRAAELAQRYSSG